MLPLHLAKIESRYRKQDAGAAGVSLLFHLAIALAAIISIETVSTKTEPPRPIEVRMIEAASRPPPQPILPQVQPVLKKNLSPKPVPKPAIIANQAPAPVPVAPVDVAPPQLAAAPPAVSPSATATYSEARFDADYLHNPKPDYPPLSKRRGETGTVFLRVYVGADGKPLEITMKTSSGSALLDLSARNAVTKWRFIPAKKGDEPVPSWVVVPINFELS